MVKPIPMHRLELSANESIRVALSSYSPDLVQRYHSHLCPAVSLLLAGAFEEVAGRREAQCDSPCLMIKPPGIRHKDRYGPDGALILSIAIVDEGFWKCLGSPDGMWRKPLPPSASYRLLRAVRAGTAKEVRGHLASLLLHKTPGNAPLSSPPGWLQKAKREINEGAHIGGIGAVAASSNKHRVHLSRSFATHFGIPPNAYRKGRMITLAFHQLAFTGTAGAAVAQNAGFFDQSHMARELKRHTSLTASQIRGLMSGANHVEATNFDRRNRSG